MSINTDSPTITALLQDLIYRDLVVESLLKNQVQLCRLERESKTHGSSEQEIASILHKIKQIDLLLDAIEDLGSTKVTD
jgi:hypothetical protein